MKVVFDTNVLVRAHPRTQGPARRLLLHVAASKSEVLITSAYILWELERVMNEPRLVRRNGLSRAEIGEYLRSLAAGSILVAPSDLPPALLRDPADSPVLGTALAGGADILCTRDKDFYEDKVRQFCLANGVYVMTDLKLIETLKI